MKRIIISLFVFCFALAIHAQTKFQYNFSIRYAGAHSLYRLLQSVGGGDSDDPIWLYFFPREDDCSCFSSCFLYAGVPEDYIRQPGFCWTESGKYGVPDFTWCQNPGYNDERVYPCGEDLFSVPYLLDPQQSGKNNAFLRHINWSNWGYVQKDDRPIIIVQHPSAALTLPEDIEKLWNPDLVIQNDLRWLKYIDLSGNFFHTINIFGYNLLDKFEYLDLSNNPTLKTLNIVGCPNLKVNVEGCHPDLKVNIIKDTDLSFYLVWEMMRDWRGDELAGMLRLETTDIGTINPDNKIDVYYANGQLFVSANSKTITEIYTLSGQKALSGTGSVINVSSLNKGCYIAKVKSDIGNVQVVKFIK